MFRLVNVNGRAALEHDGSWYDLAALSGDDALADPIAAVARHRELHALAERCAPATPGGTIADTVLGAPVPQPRQSFGIGLNYRDHAGETGAQLPPAPLTFTKFPSCIAGPDRRRSALGRDGRLGGRDRRGDRHRELARVASPTRGASSPASRSARTSPTARCR